jgi:hypothetical protein
MSPLERLHQKISEAEEKHRTEMLGYFQQYAKLSEKLKVNCIDGSGKHNFNSSIKSVIGDTVCERCGVANK